VVRPGVTSLMDDGKKKKKGSIFGKVFGRKGKKDKKEEAQSGAESGVDDSTAAASAASGADTPKEGGARSPSPSGRKTPPKTWRGSQNGDEDDAEGGGGADGEAPGTPQDDKKDKKKDKKGGRAKEDKKDGTRRAKTDKKDKKSTSKTKRDDSLRNLQLQGQEVDPDDPDFQAFAGFDTDCSGSISELELGELLKIAGLEVDDGQLEEILKSADTDHNGTLSFPEFKALMVRCRSGDLITSGGGGGGGDGGDASPQSPQKEKSKKSKKSSSKKDGAKDKDKRSKRRQKTAGGSIDGDAEEAAADASAQVASPRKARRKEADSGAEEAAPRLTAEALQSAADQRAESDAGGWDDDDELAGANGGAGGGGGGGADALGAAASGRERSGKRGGGGGGGGGANNATVAAGARGSIEGGAAAASAMEDAADPLDRNDPDFRIWSTIDADGGGTVTTEELGELFSSAGLELTAAQTLTITRHADLDGSGRLDFTEFKSLLVRCREGGVDAMLRPPTPQEKQKKQEQQQQQQQQRAATPPRAGDKISRMDSNASSSSAGARSAGGKSKISRMDSSRSSVASGAGTSVAGTSVMGGGGGGHGGADSLAAMTIEDFAKQHHLSKYAEALRKLGVALDALCRMAEEEVGELLKGATDPPIALGGRHRIILALSKHRKALEAEAERAKRVGGGAAGAPKRMGRGGSSRSVVSSSGTSVAGGAGGTAALSSAGGAGTSVNGSASVKSFGASGASVSGASGSFSKAGSVVSGGAAEDEAAALLSKSGAQSPVGSSSRPPRKNRKKGSLAASLTSSKTSSVDGGAAAASKPASGAAVAAALASTGPRRRTSLSSTSTGPRRRTSLSSVASDQSAGRDDARSSAGSGLSDAEPAEPEAATATARTLARGARTVRKKTEVSDVPGSGSGGSGGAPAPAPPVKVHVPPSLRQRLTRIFRAFDVLGTDAMATDDLPAALQQCFDCHNAEHVPLAQKQVREAAAAASGGGGHGGTDKDKAGGIAAAVTRVSAVTAQAAAVGAVVAPSDEEIATLLSETRLVPQEKSGKGLHALGLSLTLPQVLMLCDRWYSARGAVVLAARRKKLASEQERRRGSIGRGGGMKKLGPGNGPRSRPSVGTHLGLDPAAHAALMASASAAGHEVGENGAGGEEGEGGGKARKKSLAAVDHYELLKQLALSGGDSALEPEHEDKLDVSFTVADEPKFSLAGHLARKDHARRDKGEAATVGGAGERGADEAALIFTEDLPNYALEAAAAAPHTGRRMTRYGRGGKEGLRGRPTDAELLAELDTGEAGAPGARKPRSGSMGSVAESGSGLGGEAAAVAGVSDAEFERAAHGAFRSFAVQGRGGAASGIGAATLYDALRSLGFPPSATELRTLVAGVGSGGVISAAGFVQIAQQQRAAAMDAVAPLRGRKAVSSPGRNGARALGASGSVVGGGSELGEPKKSRRDSNGSLRSSIRPSRRVSATEGAGARTRRRTSNSSSAVHFGGKASLQDDGDSVTGSTLSAARRAATHNVSEEDRPLFEVFRAYDEDGSGSVDAEELMKALRKAGYTPTEEQVYSLMEEVDKDGSGECEWAEFKQLVAALKMRRDQFIQRGVSVDGGEQPAADEKAPADGSAPAVVVNKRGRRTRKGRPTQAQKDSAVVVQSRMRGFLDRKRVQQVRQHRSEQMALALQEYRTCVTGILLGSTIDERARGFVRQQQLDRKITEDQHAHVLEKLGWTIAEFEAGGKGRGGNADANANANDANSDDPDWQMWVEFDEGGSDAVAKDELADLFNAAGVNLDAAQLKIVHSAADKDGGVLCFKDFKALAVACREGGTDALLRAADPAAAAVADAAAAAEDEEFAPLKAWLIEQGLEKNFDALKESEMSLEGLLDMDGDELTEFLVEIKVPAGARKRLKLAVKHSVEANKGAKVLDDWLSEHNLTKFTAQIKASEMTLDSLLEMEPSDFKDYAQELGLTAGVRMRFAKALAKTTRTASPVDSKGTPPAADARLLPQAGAQGLRQSDSPVADGSPGAPSKATVLTSFKGTLSAILVNKSLTTEQVAFVTSYRLKHGITETEMTSVIADLGWTMERYAKLEKGAKAAPLTKMGQSTRSVVESEKGDGDAEEAEAKKTSRWGSSTAKKKKEVAKPAAKAAAAVENPRAIVQVTLGTGPLGITLNKNNCAAPAASPDISAVVDEVSGAAERTGKIKPGQFLAVINQEPASGLDFDATHKALAAASRPLTLLLSNPAKPDDPELFPCYAADDPTGKFPEKIGLYLHAEGSVEDYGLQVFEPTSGKTICFWTWPMIIKCERKMQSDDPDDMELLFVSIKALGTFSFEANSMLEFYLDLEKRLAIHPHASAADALPVPAGSPSSGSTAAKDLGVYTVTLAAGPMGLSIEQNTHGPDISAIIDGVSGASLKTGKMAIGHMLVSVNGASMTDFSFVEVLEEIKSASRPVELVFVSPPSLDNPDLFDCYTADDPTGGFPEAVKLLIRGDHGLQIIDARAGATVAYFPWQMLPQCHCEVSTRDRRFSARLCCFPCAPGC